MTPSNSSNATIDRSASSLDADSDGAVRIDQQPGDAARGSAQPVAPPSKRQRKNTAAFKHVPQALETREAIKRHSERFVRELDKSRPFSRDELEAWSCKVLSDLGLDETFLGFTMVLVGNFYWKQQFLAIPFNRRILLLPHCLKHAEGCPAEYNEFGLDCERCGACAVGDYKVKAEKLGYKVLVAEARQLFSS